MAYWPLGVKVFTTVVNGITKLVANLFNTGYDEITAVQTSIGPPGTSQSKNAAIMDLFRDFFNNLPRISYIDGDTIEIEAKEFVMYSGGKYVIKRNTSAIQIKLSANLDTGSESGSTVYYVWLTGDGSASTYSATFSLSSSAPTGYTYVQFIGKVYNDSGSNIDSDSVVGIGHKVKLGAWNDKDKDGTTLAVATTYQADTVLPLTLFRSIIK